MSNYELILDEIVARLQGSTEHPAFVASGIQVEKDPEKLPEHDKLDPKVHARIRVAFMQDRYGTDENDTARDVGSAQMDRIMYYNLSIESRAKYGEKGALVVCEKALQILLGYESNTIGGELYAFATAFEELRDNIWYHRVVVRWKNLPLRPLDTFRLLGDENPTQTSPQDPGLPSYITSVTFTPEQINVLDGETPGYLDYLSDETGNRIYLPQGYVIVKKY